MSVVTGLFPLRYIFEIIYFKNILVFSKLGLLNWLLVVGFYIIKNDFMKNAKLRQTIKLKMALNLTIRKI